MQTIHLEWMGSEKPAMSIWGRNPVFDRAWTLVGLLVMALLAMLFAFNFWVA